MYVFLYACYPASMLNSMYVIQYGWATVWLPNCFYNSLSLLSPGLHQVYILGKLNLFESNNIYTVLMTIKLRFPILFQTSELFYSIFVYFILSTVYV